VTPRLRGSIGPGWVWFSCHGAAGYTSLSPFTLGADARELQQQVHWSTPSQSWRSTFHLSDGNRTLVFRWHVQLMADVFFLLYVSNTILNKVICVSATPVHPTWRSNKPHVDRWLEEMDDGMPMCATWSCSIINKASLWMSDFFTHTHTHTHTHLILLYTSHYLREEKFVRDY